MLKTFIVGLCIVFAIVFLFGIVDAMPRVDMPWDYGYINQFAKDLVRVVSEIV